MNKLFRNRQNSGITLIALVVTIIVLLLLAGISINMITDNSGLFNKAQVASDKTKENQATEMMNLKITNIQISNYAEKQEMPTLQELADKLCEDDEMQYVVTQSKKIATVGKLEKIIVGEAKSIFTKLKAYPYEFEINSSLQLASIDGDKIESGSENIPVTDGSSYIVYIDDKKSTFVPTKDDGYFFASASCTEGASATLDTNNWTIVWSNVTNTNTVCTLYFYTINDWRTLLKLANIDSSIYNDYDEVISDTNALNAVVTNEQSMTYLKESPELLDKISYDYICSNSTLFSNIINNETIFLKFLEDSEFRNSMYNNYKTTQNLISNSSTALNTITKASKYVSTTCNSYTRVSSATSVSETIYSGKAFLLNVKVTYNSNRLTIGTFLDGTANYSLTGTSEGSGTVTYKLNKFMKNIKGAKYNCSNNPTAVYYYLKI